MQSFPPDLRIAAPTGVEVCFRSDLLSPHFCLGSMFHVYSGFVWHPVSSSLATCQKVWSSTALPVTHTEYYPSRSTQLRQNIKVSLSSHIHVDNRGRWFTRPSLGALKKALAASSEAQVFENKHAAVPKPFHILKRRQSTNLWIGRPGTPVTNVISAWHRGFKPIQPPHSQTTAKIMSL